jgi:hypothetical protein
MSDPGRAQHPALSADVIEAIRKEAVTQVAKWAVAAFALLVLATVTGWWLYLKPTLIKSLGGVPTRAVIAFDDPGACSNLGDGWEDAGLEGRFIVGADKLDGAPGGKWPYRSH